MSMDTLQLLHLFSGNTAFLGVYPCDLLPQRHISKRPFGLIVNTHPHTLPGEHWLALYFPSPGYGEFFDSYGRPPDSPDFPASIVMFLEQQAEKYTFHQRQLQHPSAVTCGQHCAFFLLNRTKGVDYENILKMYSNADIKNDQMVKLFVKTIKVGRGLGTCNRHQCMQTCLPYCKIKKKT